MSILLPNEAPVLIVGAGPVGTALALELASWNVPSLVIERSLAPSQHPKMDFLNAASMEQYASLGLEGAIRSEGVSATAPFRFLWRRDLDSSPLSDWCTASVEQQTQAIENSHDGTMPSRAHQRILGSTLERISREACHRNPQITLAEGHEVVDIKPDLDGVIVTVRDETSGTTHRLRAEYVVGCDGARSSVREAARIGMDDREQPVTHTDVYLRSSDPRITRHGSTFLTILGTGVTAVSRNGEDTWTFTYPHLGGIDESHDPLEVLHARVGKELLDIDEVIHTAQWEGRLSVAQIYRRNRIFIAGDAAHRFFPTGGHGANTGLGDAANLGWKLASVLNGSAHPALLDSYESERRPVALLAREMCANLLNVWRRFPGLVAAGASDAILTDYLDRESFQVGNLGIHFAADYSDSPVVATDTGVLLSPTWAWNSLSPEITAGHRLPHVALSPGHSTHDDLHHGWTLIGGDTELLRQLREAGLDVSTRDWSHTPWHSLHGDHRVLVRPDRVVAWVGELGAAAPKDLGDIVLGRRSTEHTQKSPAGAPSS